MRELRLILSLTIRPVDIVSGGHDDSEETIGVLVPRRSIRPLNLFEVENVVMIINIRRILPKKCK